MAGDPEERPSARPPAVRGGGFARTSVLHERKTDVRRLSAEGLTDAEIGGRLGASASAVRNFRQREGILKARPTDWDGEAVARWVSEGRSDAWIGERVGASASAVQAFRFKAGISRRYPRGKPDPETVGRLVAEGKGDAEIGQVYGVTENAIARLRSRHGIRRKRTLDEGDLERVRLWVAEGRSDAWIGARLGRSEASVTSARARHGLRKKGALKGREADIRRWVREGRTDEWIAQRLNSTAGGVSAFRSKNGLLRPPNAGRAAVAAENRRAVIRAMRGGPVAGYAAFAEATGLSSDAVRRHLRELEREGLVEVAWSHGHPGRPMVARLVEAADPEPR